MTTETNDQAFLIKRLLNPSAFPHQVKDIELLETHISWVILTGDFAYKIKKPVDFGFVNYSSLEKRKHFCELEVKLNRRFAKEMYLGVVAIAEENGRLYVGDSTSLTEAATSAIEFAVKMRQFPQESIVAARLQHSELNSDALATFGRYLATFHESIEFATPTIDCVQPAQIVSDALGNFPVIKSYLENDPRLSTLERLEKWTVDQTARLAAKFKERLLDGKVRRCHGDLHLKNIVQLHGELTAFDGIEFNEEFQWIDVLSEIAFPVMDFLARGRSDLAWRLLNSYLEETGDYADLEVLRFYLVYRAMVRAKVTCLNPKNRDPARQKNNETNGESPSALAGPWDKYLNAATYFAFELKPKLTITHGFSGSGKSTIVMELIEGESGIRIRSDVERHRLAKKVQAEDKYSAAMNDWVYVYLLELAISVADAGFPVFIDATFLSLERRMPFSKSAKRKSLPFEIIDCDASFDELCKRILNRGPDASEATIEVLEKQMACHDPLTTDELSFAKKVSVT